MAVSKEMAQRMQDVLKPKPSKPISNAGATAAFVNNGSSDYGAATVAAFMPKTRGQLIKMTMFFE